MRINRNNYESYFIDYLEGNLDEKIMDDFLEFLQQNPDLKEELLLAEPVSLPAESISFKKKKTLYKQTLDSEKEFNSFAVAYLENDLSSEEVAEFESYISVHPEKKKDLELFAKTKLTPDLAVVFNKKKKLYKKSSGRTVLLWSVRIAAVLILGVAFFVLFDKSDDRLQNNNEIAEVKSITPEISQLNNSNDIDLSAKKEQTKVVAATIPAKNNSDQKHQVDKSEKVTVETRGEETTQMLVPQRMTVPEKIEGFTASVDIEEVKVSQIIVHKRIIIVMPDEVDDDDEFLADAVKEKSGIENISSNKLKIAGLKLISGYAKKNLTYKTGVNGEITEINYDSRLLAFSIPTAKKEK
jgi:hypothetical protein